MPAVVRLGDVCTGHADWPSRPNDQGSPDTNVNNIPVHRVGDHWVTHCNHRSECHDSVLAQGSPDTFVNDLAVGRIGDPIVCGSFCATGSPDTFVNGF
jgi:uncharacterized Zn-binding protein involved in type VI secretion